MATASQSDQAAADNGKSADKPTDIPAQGWKEILIRTWKEGSNDNLGIIAAGVSYYSFLAMVPLLGAAVLIYGLAVDPQTVVQHVTSLTTMMPAQVATLIGEQLTNVVQTSSGTQGLALVIALLISLWGARNAAGSVITALNIAYEEEEKRGLIKTNLLAIGMTLGVILLLALAAGAIAIVGYAQQIFPGLGRFGAILWSLVSYVLLGAIAAAAAATLFRYGPSRENAKWTWLTPGSIGFAVVWIVLTLGFGFYVSNFGNYGATYGSLSAIIVLLTWLFLSAYALLYAAELNSEIEHQTAEDTTDEGRKPVGARGAWSADHVAAGAGDTDKPARAGARPEENRGPHSRHSRSDGQESGPAAGAGDQSRVPASTAVVHEDDGHPFITSRLTNKAGRLVGTAKVSMIGSALATLGLGYLRRRGKEATGAALLGAAAGLALLRRKD